MSSLELTKGQDFAILEYGEMEVDVNMRVVKKSEMNREGDALVETYEALTDDEALEFVLGTSRQSRFDEYRHIKQTMRDLWHQKQISRLPKFCYRTGTLWCFKAPKDWRHPSQWCGLCSAPVVGLKSKHFEEVHPIYGFSRVKTGMYSAAYGCAVCGLKIYALERLIGHYQTAHPELIVP